jgi:DNA topoisomerase-1
MNGKTEGGGKILVIVESKAKAKTINKFLGSDYEVIPCIGHVRDLRKHQGVDIEDDFAPKYVQAKGRGKVISELKKAARKAKRVILATDPDREGEAIAWHLCEILGLDVDTTDRMEFNEITRSAIQHALSNLRCIDHNRVNAQETRRVLDRLYGYGLSDLLKERIVSKIGTGRVQAVATRFVVEREREIRDFLPTESWEITGIFCTNLDSTAKLRIGWQGVSKSNDGSVVVLQTESSAWLSEHACFSASLTKVKGERFDAVDENDCQHALDVLGAKVISVQRDLHPDYLQKDIKTVRLAVELGSTDGAPWSIESISRRESSSKALMPFTTASLLSAASGLGFSPEQTTQKAQQLYNGFDVGNDEGPVGLITYMRTDSTAISDEARKAARMFVQEEYGEDYLGGKSAEAKSKHAQAAHEAIRPTDVRRTPDSLTGKLPEGHLGLYDLIWRRFVASQMVPPKREHVTAIIRSELPTGTVEFKATGSTQIFDGYQRVEPAKTEGSSLPLLEERATIGLPRPIPASEVHPPEWPLLGSRADQKVG